MRVRTTFRQTNLEKNESQNNTYTDRLRQKIMKVRTTLRQTDRQSQTERNESQNDTWGKKTERDG